MEKKIQKKRREEEESIASSNATSANRLSSKPFNFQAKKLKQTFVKDMENAKFITKKAINHDIEEMLLLFTELNNALSDVLEAAECFTF